MEKSPNTKPVFLFPRLSPVLLQHTAYPYCMRTNFSDNLSDRFVQGLDVFSRRGLSEWHKLALIKILTIHAKWSFSVNTADGGSKWRLRWASGERRLGFSVAFCFVVAGKAGIEMHLKGVAWSRPRAVRETDSSLRNASSAEPPIIYLLCETSNPKDVSIKTCFPNHIYLSAS